MVWVQHITDSIPVLQSRFLETPYPNATNGTAIGLPISWGGFCWGLSGAAVLWTVPWVASGIYYPIGIVRPTEPKVPSTLRALIVSFTVHEVRYENGSLGRSVWEDIKKIQNMH